MYDAVVIMASKDGDYVKARESGSSTDKVDDGNDDTGTRSEQHVAEPERQETGKYFNELIGLSLECFPKSNAVSH